MLQPHAPLPEQGDVIVHCSFTRAPARRLVHARRAWLNKIDTAHTSGRRPPETAGTTSFLRVEDNSMLAEHSSQLHHAAPHSRTLCLRARKLLIPLIARSTLHFLVTLPDIPMSRLQAAGSFLLSKNGPFFRRFFFFQRQRIRTGLECEIGFHPMRLLPFSSSGQLTYVYSLHPLRPRAPRDEDRHCQRQTDKAC